MDVYRHFHGIGTYGHIDCVRPSVIFIKLHFPRGSLDVPDSFLRSTILKTRITSTVGDNLTSVFAVLNKVAIHKSTIIAMLVLYLNTVRHCVALEALLIVYNRLISSVFHVVDILKVLMVIHKNGGSSLALLRGNALQLRNETNLRRLELVDRDTLARAGDIFLPHYLLSCSYFCA